MIVFDTEHIAAQYLKGRVTIEANVPRGGVLVVEDEPLVRTELTALIEGEGLEALSAAHAQEAISILNMDASRVRILFTDFVLPGEMNGIALANHVRERWPWISLFVTFRKSTIAGEDLPDSDRLNLKSYDLHTVTTHIKTLTQSKASGVPPA